MATQLGQGQQLDSQGQAQQQPGAKGDIAPVLQSLNLTSLRTRTQGVQTNIGRILHAVHANPAIKWSEVLGQFAMVNVETLNLVDDIKPILRMYVVYPKNVNAENATILPVMLSSKLLPEIEAEEAAMKEQLLGGIANLPVPLQTDKLQRQIEAVRSACDVAEKVITEARKVYGLGTRPGPVALATLDKIHVTRIAEQERLLRAATNVGEGLRFPADQNQQPAILPQHLLAAFATTRDGRASSYPGADGGYAKASVPVLPPSGLRSSGQQQATQLGSRVQTPSQPIGAGGVPRVASPPQMPYMVNSPRSSSNNFNVSSPQQSQTQQQSQLAILQRTQAQQKQQQLQRQQQMQAQLQQQQQHLHQQQQLRHPSTPPIPQVGGQMQAQVAQPLLQQQKQQLQQQSQNRLTQQLAHHQQTQLQQQTLQLQQERQHALQVSQQQQNLQQQLQSSQLQAGQNTVQQASQVRPQIGQQGSSMSNLYGSGNNTLLTSNVMGGMNQSTQSQSLLQQRIQQFQQGNNQLSANQSQQNVSSMLSDSWGTGTGTQLPQNTTNLGLPLQQQQLPQTNYMNMFNNPAQANFGQNRQQPPPS